MTPGSSERNVYYHELARALRGLGYDIANKPRGDFEIQRVSATLIERFSKRHQTPNPLLHLQLRNGASCRTRTLSLSVLLQSATVSPQELASIRTEFLQQYSS